MKKVLFAVVFMILASGSTLVAQTGIKFGVKAGYNIATQYGTLPPDLTYEVNSDGRHGFTGGIFLLFPITDAFSVQQEFLYVNKGSRQDITMTQPPLTTSTRYNINYFELPILFRYTFANIGPVGIYGSSGFALSVLLNGDYAVDGVIDMGGGPTPFNESGSTDGVDKFDYNFIYGLGVKFDLFNQNVFFDYRQTIGWNTLLMPTSGDGEAAPLRNQTYTFTLGIYF